MFALHGGDVQNPKTGVTKDIIVSAKQVLNPSFISGAVFAVTGITVMVLAAFKGGAEGFDLGERKALIEAGLMKDSEGFDTSSLPWIFKKSK